MLFTSVSFVIFVAAVLLMYYIVPKKWQWIMLLCANVCFYLQAGVRGAIFMIATIISTYFCSREACDGKIKRPYDKRAEEGL